MEKYKSHAKGNSQQVKQDEKTAAQETATQTSPKESGEIKEKTTSAEEVKEKEAIPPADKKEEESNDPKHIMNTPKVKPSDMHKLKVKKETEEEMAIAQKLVNLQADSNESEQKAAAAFTAKQSMR